jgi:hypothetical protein
MKKQLSPYAGNIAYVTGTPDPTVFRLGMTNNGRSPYDRWSHDGDYRKIDYKMEDQIHEFFELADKLDHNVFPVLLKDNNIERLGVRSGEIFKCEKGWDYFLEVARHAIVQVTGAANPIRYQLDPRPYQASFVQQFIATTGDFCLFAKCRSGKSAMTMLAATESDYRSVLVGSYRTSAANSWLADAVTYTKFHEWDVIDLSVKTWEAQIVASQKANRRQLLVSTVQRQNEKFGYVSGVRAHYPNGVDLLALDECHIGGESDQFGKLKSNISYNRLLEISGTAYKTIWKYPDTNVFVWGYVEEQRAKAQGYEWAQKLPKMELVLARYDGVAAGEIYGDDPDALKNVFSTKDGKWQDAGSVQSFLRKFFSYGAMCRKQEQMLHGSQHIVMTLPKVEACYHFAQSLQEFGSPFVPLVITGESGNGQDEILKHVKTHEATICLTVWANVVGVTVPEWDTVIHGCEYQSAEFWVQFAFRGGSTRRDSWKVIDLAPQRGLQSMLEMASATAAAQGNPDADSVLRSLLEFADVFEFNNGYTVLDYNTILNQGLLGINSAKAESRAAQQEVTVGGNLDAIAWVLEGLDRVENQVMVSETINQNNTNGRGNTQSQANSLGSDENSKKAKIARERVKAAIGKLDDVITDGLLYGVELSTLPQVLAYEQFKMYTGCDPETFQFVIDSGWTNPQSLNQRIARMHLSLASSFAEAL